VDKLTCSDDDDEFSDRTVGDLIRRLDGPVRIPLSSHEKALLITVIEGTHEVRSFLSEEAPSDFQVEQQRRALDLCGLRYLISVELLASHFRRHDFKDKPADTTIHQHRLSFRNIVWASHSESQDMLLTASTKYCTDGKMMWKEAKALGVFLWLKSPEVIVRTPHLT
jgi:hypothetical protein